MKIISKKSEILKHLKELGINQILDPLNEKFKPSCLNIDNFRHCTFIIKESEYTELTGFKAVNIQACEYDNCGYGHISSRMIKVVNNHNGYVTILIMTNLNR